jgi:hypothetical protein
MLTIHRGRCHLFFAYDVAFSIDLNEAERRITAITTREKIRHKRRAPKYFQYQPPPLRVSQTAEDLTVAGVRGNAVVDLVLYDFGAVAVKYEFPIQGTLTEILPLSSDLYENEALFQDSLRRVNTLLDVIRPAVSKPNVSDIVEDYVVFQFEESNAQKPLEQAVTENSGLLAQLLRSEPRGLSDDEIRDALSHRISFTPQDITIVDWNAAVILDSDADDSLAVLEFANVELMEMRYLDHRIDDSLSLAYETLSKRPWRRFPFGSDPEELQSVAQWQVDSAILFEGVNNALKLIGDQYLARLYRLAGQRFHLAEWDASIIRKLDILNSIYGKISDQVSSRRMEILEWIIIILIAVSIALPFFISYSG